ncbi:15874_t:CDS:2, partial [Acaulospora colombiana]
QMEYQSIPEATPVEEEYESSICTTQINRPKSENELAFENFLLTHAHDGPPIQVINDVDTQGIPPDFTYVDRYLYGEGGICKGNKCRCLKELNVGKLNYSRETGQVKRGRKVHLAIKRYPEKGWGVIATKRIEANVFITYYYGEIITAAEADLRGSKYDAVGRTYLFDLDFCDDGTNENTKCLYTIDAWRYGNISHFFNHSCDPNLVVYPVMNDNGDIRLHHIAFFSKKVIE